MHIDFCMHPGVSIMLQFIYRLRTAFKHKLIRPFFADSAGYNVCRERHESNDKTFRAGQRNRGLRFIVSISKNFVMIRLTCTEHSYYDGDSLRDEKWRFDPKTGAAVVSRRNGFRDMDNFHLVDATLDALGSFTKSYHMKNEKDLIKDRVKEPHTHNDADSVRDESVKQSNAFSGVSINTQYSTQNGYPRKFVFIIGNQPARKTNNFQFSRCVECCRHSTT